VCGQSPLYVPTTINAVVKNIDAVDVAATSISCTNLTVNGEPVSNVLTNIGSSSVGTTAFDGTVTATNLTATSAVTAATVNAGSVSATGGAITGGSLTVTGSVAASNDVSGSTLTGTIATPTQNNITKIGTQTSLASSGNITQTGGTTTLLSTTVGSLSTSGNITQTGASATASLKAVTADSLNVTGVFSQASISTGNLTSTGTTTLKATTVDSLSTAGNITQTSGTTSLRGTTVSSLSVTGTVTTTDDTTIGGQLFQKDPGFLLYKLSSFPVPVSVETKMIFQSATATLGLMPLSYSSGIFSNQSTDPKVFRVSYTVVWTGVNGGRRMAYLRTSNTTGNYPQGVSTGPDGEDNVAFSYSVGTDSTSIRMTGSTDLRLASGGSFSLYLYQTGLSPSLGSSGFITITML